MWVHACMSVCVCVSACKCACICFSIRVHVCTSMSICESVRIWVCMYVWASVCVNMVIAMNERVRLRAVHLYNSDKSNQTLSKEHLHSLHFKSPQSSLLTLKQPKHKTSSYERNYTYCWCHHPRSGSWCSLFCQWFLLPVKHKSKAQLRSAKYPTRQTATIYKTVTICKVA